MNRCLVRIDSHALQCLCKGVNQHTHTHNTHMRTHTLHTHHQVLQSVLKCAKMVRSVQFAKTGRTGPTGLPELTGSLQKAKVARNGLN